MTSTRQTLAARLSKGETVVTAWSTLSSPVICEVLARAGYGAVTLDMQHGAHGIVSVQDGIAATLFGGAHPIVRPPVDDFSVASRALDFGAEAIIMPMINSVEDALALVAAAKYPPIGARSWGPHRGAMAHGITPIEYFEGANRETLALAMVETPAAVAALDEILAVDGIDGVFVGPADLSLTLSEGAGVTPGSDQVQTLTAEIAQKVRAVGKIAGIYANGLDDAQRAKSIGFHLITHGSDMGLLTGVANRQARELD